MQNSKLQFKIQKFWKTIRYTLDAKRLSKGFTLLELLIVIVIIGILSSFVSVTLFGGLARSRDAQRKSDLKQLQTALQLYFQDNNDYPDPTTTSHKCNSSETCWEDLLGDQPNPYIKAVPKDPTNDPTHLYHYCFNAGKYVIVANLENSEDPDTKDDNGTPKDGNGCTLDGENFYWVENP